MNRACFIFSIFLLGISILDIGLNTYGLFSSLNFEVFDYFAAFYYVFLSILIILIASNKEFSKKKIHILLALFSFFCLYSIISSLMFWNSDYWILSFCPVNYVGLFTMFTTLIMCFCVVYKKYIKFVDFLALIHIIIGFSGILYYIQYTNLMFIGHHIIYHVILGFIFLTIYPTEGYTKVFSYNTSGSELARKLVIFVPIILAILLIFNRFYSKFDWFSFYDFNSIGIFISVIMFSFTIFFIIFYINKINNVDLINQEYLDKTLEEKETLLVEVHHRVKNNMQIIISLLHMEERKVHDDVAKKSLKDSQNRIKAMALIHENLYKNFEFEKMDMQKYIEDVINGIEGNYSTDNIDFELDIIDLKLDLSVAMPLGLIINELVTNSIKYAFPNGENGIISIDLFKDDDEDLYVLEIADDGVGCNIDDLNNSKGIGTVLVDSLVQQIEGKLESYINEGMTKIIKFNIPNKDSK